MLYHPFFLLSLCFTLCPFYAMESNINSPISSPKSNVATPPTSYEKFKQGLHNGHIRQHNIDQVNRQYNTIIHMYKRSNTWSSPRNIFKKSPIKRKPRSQKIQEITQLLSLQENTRKNNIAQINNQLEKLHIALNALQKNPPFSPMYRK